MKTLLKNGTVIDYKTKVHPPPPPVEDQQEQT